MYIGIEDVRKGVGGLGKRPKEMGIKPVLVEGESLKRSFDIILTRESQKRVFKPVT